MKKLIYVVVVMIFCLSTQFALAGNIDGTDKYAWSENAGWSNWEPTHGGGVYVYPDHLEGYAWAENIGWVRLGTYTGGDSHTYANTNNTDYGVNVDGSGNLSGYGWSENAGWINFNPTHSQVTIDINTGEFDGYAWCENVGWIHFKNEDPAYNVKTTEVPLPVELSHFRAESVTEGVMLYWRTESEINNAGFYLYRDGVKLNAEMIDGQGTTTNPQSYSFLDETVKAGETYVYQISDVEEYTLKETFHNEVEITYTPPSDDDEVVKPAPSNYTLHDCYPNPFNPITTITFDLPEPVRVNLGIYDAQGQLVKTLVDGEMNAGSHPVVWDGTDDNGDVVSSGVYFYTITTDNFELNETKAMILMK